MARAIQIEYTGNVYHVTCAILIDIRLQRRFLTIKKALHKLYVPCADPHSYTICSDFSAQQTITQPRYRGAERSVSGFIFSTNS